MSNVVLTSVYVSNAYCPVGEPDQVLNPKKKIFEQVQPELHTDENCVATYNGVPFTVPGKGICKTTSFSNCGIK